MVLVYHNIFWVRFTRVAYFDNDQLNIEIVNEGKIYNHERNKEERKMTSMIPTS